ncbi:hypothetical protein [Nitrospira sp. Nam80]
MKVFAHFRSYTLVPWSRQHVRYFCFGIVCAVSLVGCVSKSRYETVTTEMDGLRTELTRAQGDVQKLEQQKEALHKLNVDGEQLLTGIRAELQQARASYAEYKAEQNRLEALKAKAHALQIEHAKQVQGVKAAKRDQLRMQAVIERYERDMGQAPDIGDMLRVSQATDMNGGNSRLVATVTPLPSETSSPAYPSADVQAGLGAPPAPQVVAAAGTSPAPSVTPAAPASSVQPAAKPVPPAAPSPKPQPTHENDSWLGSLTGWLSSLWGWLFP